MPQLSHSSVIFFVFVFFCIVLWFCLIYSRLDDSWICMTYFPLELVCLCLFCRVLFRVMVFNATFNNISVISCRSVLLMEETGVHGENHRPAAINPTTIRSRPRRLHLFRLRQNKKRLKIYSKVVIRSRKSKIPKW